MAGFAFGLYIEPHVRPESIGFWEAAGILRRSLYAETRPNCLTLPASWTPGSGCIPFPTQPEASTQAPDRRKAVSSILCFRRESS